MHRCYVSSENWKESIITLSPEEEHHLLNVMRAEPGDTVEVFDGQGQGAQAEVVRDDAETFLQIVPGTIKKQHSAFDIILIVALPKGKRMDLIVEKSTELGVSEIRPVITERVISRPDDKRLAERVERWNRIAISAAKQCGIDKIPPVSSVATYENSIQECSDIDILLIGDIDAAPGTMRSAIEGFINSTDNKELSTKRIGLLIGPEGDFTPEELQAAKDAGAVSVSFGELTLRVETAALYGLCVLRYALTAT